MLKNTVALYAILLLCSFAFIPPQSEEKGNYVSPKFTGKKLQETVFGEFVKESFTGKTMLMVVSYGCDHCWDATRDAQKIKDEKLIDEIVILGAEAGEPGAKDKFKKETGQSYKMIDYDYNLLGKKLMTQDS
ncbi:MAG: hypothetical protein AB1458_07230, partial [Bacteroidota bacterium]